MRAVQVPAAQPADSPDQYTFNAQANRIVTLSLANTAGFGGFSTSLATVFRPSGAQVASFGGNSQQQITLPETGTYVVQVRANDLITRGSYSLGLQCP